MKPKRIFIVFKVIFSYLIKYHPFISTWFFCWMVGGIGAAIMNLSISALIAGLLLALIPTIIKKILLMISHIGGSNPYDEEFLGKDPPERFINYFIGQIEKYTENNDI